MTDLILYSKPFDWNDNLSEEAIEDFETIRGKLTYCTHQSIGMALAKLELLEKQGCKVIDPSGSSSEKPNKCDDAISRQAVLDILVKYDNSMGFDVYNEIFDNIDKLPSVSSSEKPCEDAISRKEAISIAGIATLSVNQVVTALKKLPPVNPQKPKSECEHDHEILKAYSDGASAVLESLIEQYEHYLELLDADMKDGSATIVTKTKYAVYTEVAKQLKEVLESEDKA